MGYKDRSTLCDLYINKQMSMPSLAKHFNISQGTIAYYFRKYNIPARERIFAMRLAMQNHFSLTNKAKEFIYGELLGDMCVQSRHIYSANISYGSKYIEYIEWLSDTLNSFGIEQCGEIYHYKPKNINAIVHCYKSKRYVELKDIETMFYPNGKKIIPDIDFTPLVLRQWYIGDGSLINPKNRSPKIILSTCGFTKEDVLEAIDKLIGIGLKSNYWPASNTIYIPVSSTPDFLEYIGSCPVDCYQYKWALS